MPSAFARGRTPGSRIIQLRNHPRLHSVRLLYEKIPHLLVLFLLSFVFFFSPILISSHPIFFLFVFLNFLSLSFAYLKISSDSLNILIHLL